MIRYEDGAITITEILASLPSNDFDDMPENFVAWIPVHLEGHDVEDYNAAEMVTLSICKTDGELKIFELEWGRP